MKIQENKSFTFSFPFLGMSEMTCHVPAQTKEEAVGLLKKWFKDTITDMYIEFPEVEKKAVLSGAVLQTDFSPTQREHIGNLIKLLSAYFLPADSFQETVEKFADGVKADVMNYDEIISRMTDKLKICETGVTKVDGTESGGEIISVQDTPKKKK